MNKKIKPFEFTYTRPSLDWYENVNVSINDEDYDYFKLQLRYGKDFYLLGYKHNSDQDTDLGRIGPYDIKRFVEWCKRDQGSKLIGVHAISTSLDAMEEFLKILANR